MTRNFDLSALLEFLFVGLFAAVAAVILLPIFHKLTQRDYIWRGYQVLFLATVVITMLSCLIGYTVTDIIGASPIQTVAVLFLAWLVIFEFDIVDRYDLRVQSKKKTVGAEGSSSPLVVFLVPIVGIIGLVIWNNYDASQQQQREQIRELSQQAEAARLAAEAARREAEQARNEAATARSAVPTQPTYTGGFRPGDQAYICMNNGNWHSATVVSNSGGDRIELRPDQTFTIGLLNPQTYYANSNYFIDRSAIAGDRETCRRWAN